MFSVSNMTFHFLVHRSKWLFLDQAMMLCLMNWIIPKSRDGPWVWIIWGEESPYYLRTMLSAKCWEPPINTVHKWIFVARGGYLINSTLMDGNLCIYNDFWESPAQARAVLYKSFSVIIRFFKMHCCAIMSQPARQCLSAQARRRLLLTCINLIASADLHLSLVSKSQGPHYGL